MEKKGTGGSWIFKCSFCKEIRHGSYSVKAHLLGTKGHGVVICKSVSQAKRHEMQQLEDEVEKKKRPREVPLPCEENSALKKRRCVLSPIHTLWNINARDQLDQEIARMFYTAGLPFNVARNPHYYRLYQFATSAMNKLDGYVPPSYNKLRTILLEKERKNVEKRIICKNPNRGRPLLVGSTDHVDVRTDRYDVVTWDERMIGRISETYRNNRISTWILLKPNLPSPFDSGFSRFRPKTKPARI